MATAPTRPAPTVDPAEITRLRTQVRGEVLLPGDEGYDRSCRGFNLTHVHAPAVVVVAEGTADVAAAVRFAAATDRTVAVQATGHGIVRVADGAVLVDTSRMTHFDLDPATRRVRAAAGVVWGPVLAAAQEHGLAPLLGSSPTVGVVGYTLGGGMGWLARAHGLASDRVVAFEVVVATGEVVTATATEHPDLFWALRGAGAGSLGIVTAIEFELVPVTTVYAGNLYYPAELAREVVACWHDWIADAPDELTSAVTLMNYPPFETVPAPVRGQSFVIVRGCLLGDERAGVGLLEHFRGWREPTIDAFGPMPFADAATISNDPVDPIPATATGVWLDRLDEDTIDALVAGTLPGDGPPPLVFSEVRHAGGAIARADRSASAHGNRDARLSLEMVGTTPTPAAMAALTAHTTALKAALGTCRTGGVYLNFTEGEERRTGVVAGAGAENAARLARVKAAWDPSCRFDHGIDLRAPGGS